jgi:multisubunit Na+/H+ antiporter MnhE subunit
VKIYTDVEISYAAIICPITASLTPGSIFVDLSGDFATITVDKSKITLPTDIGSHPYTLIVNEKDWSSTVA